VLDYEMYINYLLEPNEVGFVKISKTDKPWIFNPQTLSTDPKPVSALEISGFTD
jgi:hypothetical protein